MASLTITNLSKSFGKTIVLDNVSFEVHDGEFCVLLGPSGCGKTTLLRLIAGLEPNSGGRILIGEKQVDHLPPRDRDIAFVFQSYALYPHMSVYDNLAFSLRLRGTPSDEIQKRVVETARLLEIADQLDHKPQQLSGGQRQRVAVGRAIVRQPKIFLFDEPLSNLDASLRANMRLELARLHERLHSTIVYVTHDQVEAMTLGEKIVLLNKGKIQQIDSPSVIYRRPNNTFVAAFVGSPQINLVEGRIAEDGVTFVREGFSLIIAEGLRAHGVNYVGNPVTIGIRPEDLEPADSGAATLSGEVEFIEDLGADRFIHMNSAGVRLIARASTEASCKKGDAWHVRIKPKQVHVFYNDNRVN